MTSEIRKKINQRYKRLQIALHTNNQNDWNAFKRKRNQVTSILRAAERNYWKSSQAEARQSGSKDFWKIVRRLTRKEKHNESRGPIENDEKILV